MQENVLQSEQSQIDAPYQMLLRVQTFCTTQICTNDITQSTCETPLVVVSFLTKLCLLGQGQYDFIQYFSLKVCIDFTSSVSTEHKTDETKLN